MNRIKEYLFITAFVSLFYTLTLSGYFIFIIGLNLEQYILWLWTGQIINFILSYPLGKLLVWYISKVKRFYE